MNKQVLQKYAELLVAVGSNLKKGEELYISSPVIASELARAIADAGYKMGAKKTTIMYNDEIHTRSRYLNETEEVLTNIPQYAVAMRQQIVDSKGAYIAIIAEDPDIFAGISPTLLSKTSAASRKANKAFYDATMSNKTRWTLAVYPNPKWATKIFPSKSEEDAVASLWEMIIKAMRLDVEDSIAAWRKHSDDVKRRANFLNNAQLVTLEYKNSLGTDFSVGLPVGYKFCGCSEYSQDGVLFTPNMPTEEIFTAPHKDTAEGTLVASMPLVENGNVIEDFWMKFSKGRVVDYGAKKGYDILKGLIETDEGSRYLGEIALVQFDSPIQALNTLFFNTLYDENASCHFAIGRAYPSCIEGGNNLSEEELKARGLNVSLEHSDFMIGTKDLSIVGIDKDGKRITIFKDGNFVI